MKIYFTDLKENDIMYMPLNKCVKTFINYRLLFSLDGIYKIVKSDSFLTKLTNDDKSIEETTIDKWNVLIDNSTQKLTSNMWNLPYVHKILNIHEETYILREKSDLKFIILRNMETEKIIDYYFIFNGDIDNFSFKEDMLTFLSEIK